MYKNILKNDPLFKDNKYTKIYISLIERSINRKDLSGYCEVHHILPKCIFPQYKNLSVSEWNAAKLTAREHFIAHKLLIKIVDENTNAYYKMISAFGAMVRSKKRFLSSREYDECRRAFAKALSFKRKGKTYEEIYGEKTAIRLKRMKSKKQGEINAGRKHSVNSIEKNRKSNILYRENLSEEKKKEISNKISVANKGKKKPGGFAEKISKVQKGRIKSEEEKSKLGAASRGTVFVNKDGKNTKIKMHLLDEYINNGWKKGMLTKRKGHKNEINN